MPSLSIRVTTTIVEGTNNGPSVRPFLRYLQPTAGLVKCLLSLCYAWDTGQKGRSYDDECPVQDLKS